MGVSAAGSDRRALPLSMRILLVVAFGLALAATALVVFADDVKLLRMAAVLALWVALIAAFAIARSRRDTRSAQRRQEEVRLAYEIELHREIAARTEYEAGLSRQLEAAHMDQLDALRGEIDRLASALSRLLDGDVLVERVTLSAESTRVRALSDVGQGAGGRGRSGTALVLDAPLAADGETVLGTVVDDGAAADAEHADPGGPPDAATGQPETPDARSATPDARSAGPDVRSVTPDARSAETVGQPEPPASRGEVGNDGASDALGTESADDDHQEAAPAAGAPAAAAARAGAVEAVGVQSLSLSSGRTAGADQHPTAPLPTIERGDAPATGWTWIHRSASPVLAVVSGASTPAAAGPAVTPAPTLPAPPRAAVPASPPAASSRLAPPPVAAAVSTARPGAAGPIPPANDAPAPAPGLAPEHQDHDGVDLDAQSVAIGDLLAAYGLDGGSRRSRRRD